jgi:hypothetical protein
MPVGMIDSLEVACKGGVLTGDSLQFYVDRIEDMYIGIWDLKNQYSNDVNVMIDKTDAWISYWIGVFALVLTVPAIIIAIQYYQSNKHWSAELSQLQHGVLVQKRLARLLQSRLRRREEEREKEAAQLIDDTKENFNSWIAEKDEEIRENSKELTENTKKQVDTLANDLSERVKGDVFRLEKSVKENRISSIMMCLSSFPDPQMVAEKSEIRKVVVSYLNQLYKEYRAYIMIISEQVMSRNCDYMDTCQYVRLVLLCIKLAVIRSQNSFSELNQDISIYALLRSVDDVFFGIESGRITESNLTESLIVVREKFYGVLRVMMD